VKKLTDFPTAGYLNKMATLPIPPGANEAAKASWPQCLLTDSTAGAIILFDPNTKNTSTWLSHPTMAPAPHDDPIWRITRKSAKSGRTPLTDTFGITVIACFEDHVYYVNSHRSRLWRVKFDSELFAAYPTTPYPTNTSPSSAQQSDTHTSCLQAATAPTYPSSSTSLTKAQLRIWQPRKAYSGRASKGGDASGSFSRTIPGRSRAQRVLFSAKGMAAL
jgi:hypothetical protein